MKLALPLISVLLLCGCGKQLHTVAPSVQPAATSLSKVDQHIASGVTKVQHVAATHKVVEHQLREALNEFELARKQVVVTQTQLATLQKDVDVLAESRDEWQQTASQEREKRLQAEAKANKAGATIFKLWAALFISWACIIGFMIFRAKLKSIPIVGMLIP